MEKLNKMAAELDEEITRDLVNVLVKAKKLDEIWGGAHQQYQNALDTVARELGQTTWTRLRQKSKWNFKVITNMAAASYFNQTDPHWRAGAFENARDPPQF
ncbi:hypothetical protein JX266_007481 [Neoarthrinium moseri]|nr:hypothetical protein JX266_007481 [Neoarthrinium moseri]